MHDLILFKRVKTSEFYRCAWSKPNRDKEAPNLTALAAAFERVTQWIASCVLVPSSKERARRIQKLVSVAQRLLRLNNFHTMMAVLSGLNLNPVGRLKATWAQIPTSSLVLLEEMRTLMDSKNNFAQYRRALLQVLEGEGEFGMPFIPVILRDIMFSYETLSGDCTVDNVRLMGKQLSVVTILQGRKVPDDFTVKDSLLHFFSTITPESDEETLYQTSVRLEPVGSPPVKSRKSESNSLPRSKP